MLLLEELAVARVELLLGGGRITKDVDVQIQVEAAEGVVPPGQILVHNDPLLRRAGERAGLGTLAELRAERARTHPQKW